jgi:hypothetical protein
MGLKEQFEKETGTPENYDPKGQRESGYYSYEYFDKYTNGLESKLTIECAPESRDSTEKADNTGSPKLLNSLQSALSLVKNGMSSEEIHRVRGVIADAIDQLRADA